MPIPNKLLENFKYPLHQLKKGESAILKWPDIDAYREVFLADNLDKGVDVEVVMKYLILCYTPGSPLIQQHPHIGKRKTQVMKMLDIPCDENGHYGDYNNVLLLRDEKNEDGEVTESRIGMRSRLVTFLRIQHHTDYTIYVHAQEELEEILKQDIPLDGDEGMKRRKFIEETRLQMEKALDRITKHDKTKAVEDSVQKFTAQRVLPIRIENRLHKLGDSVSPEFAVKGKPMAGD